MGTTIFTSDRLHVRQLELSDLDPFYAMLSNPNVMRHVKPTLNYEESKVELDTFISHYSDKERLYSIWAVTTISGNHFVGICGVYQNQKSEYELAYRLLEQYWGIGYGKEIAHNLIKYCFDHLELPELVAHAASANIGSIKILEKEMNFVLEEPSLRTGALGKWFVLKSNEINRSNSTSF